MWVRGGHFNLLTTHSPPSLQVWVGGVLYSPPVPSPSVQMWVGGVLYSPPVPPPSLQMWVGGGVLSFDQLCHQVTAHSPPSLQTWVGGVFNSSPTTHHLFPLPRLKCESEGGILLLLPPIPLFCFKCKLEGPFTSSSTTCFPSLTSKCKSEGAFWVSTNHVTTHYPPSLQMWVREGHFNLVTTFSLLPHFKHESEAFWSCHHLFPSLASNASQRGESSPTTHSPSLTSNVTEPESDSNLIFTRYLVQLE